MKTKHRYEIHEGDCLEILPSVPTHSVDAIICDLPYGTTDCRWDTVIPFDRLWEQYRRIIKPGGAVVLFGSEPFSSTVRMSNLKWFRYDWIWEKSRAGNYVHAKFQPLKSHETISVFSELPASSNKTKGNNMPYFPQFSEGKPYVVKPQNGRTNDILHGDRKPGTDASDGKRYPRSVVYFKTADLEPDYDVRYRHPTQKPVELMKYLIETYTKPGELVLDNTMGCGTTGVAALRCGRRFFGIDLLPEHFDYSLARLRAEAKQTRN